MWLADKPRMRKGVEPKLGCQQQATLIPIANLDTPGVTSPLTHLRSESVDLQEVEADLRVLILNEKDELFAFFVDLIPLVRTLEIFQSALKGPYLDRQIPKLSDSKEDMALSAASGFFKSSPRSASFCLQAFHP
ncbi:Uncharacterized protein Fot_13858 [Forsythia ovata]|uniref:Uncharacterized protein n=1 Tax=Forsythia ovata TaxID=205694 RepID=A0ABD1W862_9LAMI